MEALLVCSSPRPGAERLVSELASRADLVIGVDGGARVCLTSGVTPDVIVGDMDSLPARDRDVLMSRGVRFEIASADKDVTDLDLALAFAASHGADRVTVTACTAGRLDHGLAVIGSLARYGRLHPRLAEPALNGRLLSMDGLREIPVEGNGATFSVIAVVQPACVSVRGAKWPLDHATLEPLGSLGVSNVVEDGATVELHAGIALVVTENDGGSATNGVIPGI